MTSTLLVIQVILSIAIIIAVLLQKSSSIGLGAYSGSNESMFGAKGPASFLAKTTFVLALLFIINTLAMGYLYNKDKNQSVADTISTTTAVPKTMDNTPNTPPKAIDTNATLESNKTVVETNATKQVVKREDSNKTAPEANTTKVVVKKVEDNKTVVETNVTKQVVKREDGNKTAPETNTTKEDNKTIIEINTIQKSHSI